MYEGEVKIIIWVLHSYVYTKPLGAFLGEYDFSPSPVFYVVKKVSAPLGDHFPDELAVLRVLYNHLL